MPKRMIRDWTDSETVDQLSPLAEVFFTRLIMKADDYGNYPGNPKLINAALFPLKEYTATQIAEWSNECRNAGLIVWYHAEGKPYIHIKNFEQKLRRMRAVYPPPPVGQVTDNERTSDGQVTDNVRPEVEEEEKKEEEVEEKAKVVLWPTFIDFWDLYAKKVDRPKCEKKWLKIKQADREKIMLHVEEYVKSTPDVQYRKNPATYLNNESWNNEIIAHAKLTQKTAHITREQRDAYIDAKYGNPGTAQK